MKLFIKGYFTPEIQGEGLIGKANYISLTSKLKQGISLKGKNNKSTKDMATELAK